MIDTTTIRSRFPALHRQYSSLPIVFFDNPAGTQVPQDTIDGMVCYMECSNANVGGYFITSKETEEIIREAREATATRLAPSSAARTSATTETRSLRELAGLRES